MLNDDFADEEWQDWYGLSPEEQFLEAQKLYEVFLLMGGTLDPEPDSQSPFNDFQIPLESIADGRSGLYSVRRGGVHP
jgi:hypothetical protein